MSSIDFGISKLHKIKKDIHTAIEEKGVTVANDAPFDEYASKIGEITGGGGNEDTDYAAMLVLEGIDTGTERSKSEIETAVAAVLATI